MAKKKIYPTQPPQVLKPKPMGDMPKISKDLFKPDNIGKLEGQYWIWPDGTKTSLKFIRMGIQRYKPLPKGFYAAAAKANLTNLNLLVSKAKQLGLRDTLVK